MTAPDRPTIDTDSAILVGGGAGPHADGQRVRVVRSETRCTSARFVRTAGVRRLR